jgi:hypothetical protein
VGVVVTGTAAVVVFAYQVVTAVAAAALGVLLSGISQYVALVTLIVATFLALAVSMIVVLSTPPLLAPFMPAVRVLGALAMEWFRG